MEKKPAVVMIADIMWKMHGLMFPRVKCDQTGRCKLEPIDFT